MSVTRVPSSHVSSHCCARGVAARSAKSARRSQQRVGGARDRDEARVDQRVAHAHHARGVHGLCRHRPRWALKPRTPGRHRAIPTSQWKQQASPSTSKCARVWFACPSSSEICPGRARQEEALLTKAAEKRPPLRLASGAPYDAATSHTRIIRHSLRARRNQSWHDSC